MTVAEHTAPDRLDRLTEAVEGMRLDLARHIAICEADQRNWTAVRNEVYGQDGDERGGLKGRVRAIEVRCTQIQADKKHSLHHVELPAKSVVPWWPWLMAAGMVALSFVGGMLGTLLRINGQ